MPTPAPAATPTPEVPVRIYDQNISGEVKQDQIWSGTIHVTGDVRVKEGVTLTILPGTKVIITAHQDDQHGGEVDPGREADPPEAIELELKAGYPPKDDEYVKSHVTIEIKGTLNAIGTQQNRIIFTSDSASPTTYDWYRLRIWNGNLEYAIVEYARMVTIEGPDVKISNSIVRHMLEGAISIGCLDKTASPIISNNEIYDAGNECVHIVSGSVVVTNNTLRPGRERMLPGYGGNGIVIWDMYWDWLGVDKMGNPLIENNLIEEANWSGIAYRSATSSPIIRYNTIRNSTTGICFERSGTGNPVIHHNNIYNNKDNNVNNMVNQTFNLSNNWWGTTGISEIDAKIWDYNDDSSLGKVNYEPFETAKIADAGLQD